MFRRLARFGASTAFLLSVTAHSEVARALDLGIRMPGADSGTAAETSPSSVPSFGASGEHADASSPGSPSNSSSSGANIHWASGPLTENVNGSDTTATPAQPSWGQCEFGGALAVNLPRAAALVPGVEWLGAQNLAVSDRRCTRSNGFDDATFAGSSSAGRSLNVGSAELVWNSAHSETGLRGAVVRWNTRDSLLSTNSDDEYAYGPGGEASAWNPDSRWLPVQDSIVDQPNSAYRVGLRQSHTWAGWKTSADVAWTVASDGPEMAAGHHWAARAQVDRPVADGMALSASWLYLAPGDLQANALAIPGEQWVLGVNVDSSWFLPRALGIPMSAGLNWRYVRPDAGLDSQIPASREINLGMTVPF